MAYLVETHKLVEPLYQLEKDKKLSPENPNAAEGREFLDAQLVRGGQMLGDLWFSPGSRQPKTRIFPPDTQGAAGSGYREKVIRPPALS